MVYALLCQHLRGYQLHCQECGDRRLKEKHRVNRRLWSVRRPPRCLGSTGVTQNPPVLLSWQFIPLIILSNKIFVVKEFYARAMKFGMQWVSL